MEIMLLEMFVAAVEERTFRKAAERVYRTQPAVSMGLKKLEEEVGTQLFDRSNRNGYVLTDSGNVLYGYAKQILGVRDDARTAVDRLRILRNSRARIGVEGSGFSHLIPSLVRAVRSRYPKIKLEISEHRAEDLRTMLRRGDLDIVITRQPIDGSAEEDRPAAKVKSSIESDCVIEDEVVLVVGAEHPLAGRATVRLRELETQPVLVATSGPLSSEHLTRASSSVGAPAEVILETSSIDSIKALIQANAGVSFLPRAAVKTEADAGLLIPIRLEDLDASVKTWIARRTADSKTHAVHAVYRVLRSLYAENSEVGIADTRPQTKRTRASGPVAARKPA